MPIKKIPIQLHYVSEYWLNVAECANKSNFLLNKQLQGYLTAKNLSYKRNEGKDQ